MDHDHDDGALPEPTERDYREGVIILIILIFVVIFELYLRARLSESLRDRVEVTVVFLSLGLIHLFGSHLLAFLYNCKHLILLRFLDVCNGQARPRHAKIAGVAFLLAGIVHWFL
jgi:hypothetical protein